MCGVVRFEKKRFFQQKNSQNHVGGICNKIYKSVFYSSMVFLHFCHKSIFSELGRMVRHPTHDSAKSSPNVHLSCPTQFCFHRRSQLVFFSPCETLDQPIYRVTFSSPESTPDAGIFFLVVTKITQTTLFFSKKNTFCKQLTPQPTTVSHFLKHVDVPR